jgi:hypothetical protein
VDVPDGFVTRQDTEGDSVWEEWSWMDALATDGVLDYEMFSEAEEAIKMLDLGLEKPGTLSDAMVTRNVNRLIKASRVMCRRRHRRHWRGTGDWWQRIRRRG